jgi:hypothetical protein
VPKQIIEEPALIQDVLARGMVGYMAMAKKNEPYVVPLSYVAKNGNIFIHCALKGRKLEFLLENPRVCFAVHQVDEIHRGATACTSGIRYHSILAFGQARFVKDTQVKMEVCRWLAEKYAPGTIVDIEELRTIQVIEIVVEKVTGKRNVTRAR